MLAWSSESTNVRLTVTMMLLGGFLVPMHGQGACMGLHTHNYLKREDAYVGPEVQVVINK